MERANGLPLEKTGQYVINPVCLIATRGGVNELSSTSSLALFMVHSTPKYLRLYCLVDLNKNPNLRLFLAMRAVIDDHNQHKLYYLSLLSAKSHLSGHDALPFSDERAFGASTVPPAAVALVSFKGRHDAVIAAPGAFRRPLVALGCAEEQSGRGSGSRRRNSSVVMVMMPLVVLSVMVVSVMMRRSHVPGQSGEESVRTHHSVAAGSGAHSAAATAAVPTGYLMAATPMRRQVHGRAIVTDRQAHYIQMFSLQSAKLIGHTLSGIDRYLTILFNFNLTITY